MILVKQMFIFLVMMIIGFYMAKKGIVEEKATNCISWLIVNVANPAMIIYGSVDGNLDQKTFLFILALSSGMYVSLIVLAEILIPLFHFKEEQIGVYKVLMTFSNMGFMGFPIMSAMFGAKSLLYAAVFMLPFNLLIYTYGVYRFGGKITLREILKKCCNTGVIAVILMLVIALCHITLPGVIIQMTSMLSNLTGPLCMIIIGASFVEISLKDSLCDVKLLLFSVLKLIVLPLIIMFFVRHITENQMLQNVTFIIVATPCASMSALLAQQCNGDYFTASKGIAVTTVLSVVTMPFLFMILGM